MTLRDMTAEERAELTPEFVVKALSVMPGARDWLLHEACRAAEQRMRDSFTFEEQVAIARDHVIPKDQTNYVRALRAAA